jgi:pimeloyl-ACP methyl ester carboxylesterase
LPKFQFVRSFSTREDSLLFVSDSTILQGDKITLGWLAGNKDTPLAQLVTDSVNRARQQAKVNETVLAGHSAGGFAAILVGSQVPNSRAVSVNGQTVVDRFWFWTVKNLNKYAFPECESPQAMMEQYVDRLDLRVALQNRLSTSSFTYFGNHRDPATFGDMPHFELLAEVLGLDAQGGRTLNGDAFVVADWNKEGASPHALPGSMMPFLILTLDEGQPSVPVEYTVDPRWQI